MDWKQGKGRITSQRAGGATPARLEVQGVPPVAVEALLDYCYKDKYVIVVFAFTMMIIFVQSFQLLKGQLLL